MDAKPNRRLALRIAAYVGFTLASLVVAFFLTFPYDTLKDRMRQEADSAGYFLRIGGLGPGFFGLRATDVQLSKKSDADPPPEPLKLDVVSVGPSFFPPGASVKVKGLGGTITATVSGLSTTRVKVDADELDFARGNVKGFSGIDLSGNLDAHLELTIPRTATGAGAQEPDLSQASGSLALDTKNLSINGGNISIPIPQFGPEPTPIDLPKIALGDITGRIKIDKGAANLDDFKSRSTDLETGITGTLKLGKRVEYSEAALEIRLKTDPEFQKRLGLLGSAFSMIAADPKDPAWRMGHLTGYLGRPQFH